MSSRAREPAVGGVDNDRISDNERHGSPIDEPSVGQISVSSAAGAARSSHVRELSVDQTSMRLSSPGGESSVGQSLGSVIVDEVNLNVGDPGGGRSLVDMREGGGKQGLDMDIAIRRSF